MENEAQVFAGQADIRRLMQNNCKPPSASLLNVKKLLGKKA